jgi:hypothetical protein
MNVMQARLSKVVKSIERERIMLALENVRTLNKKD